MPITTMFQTTDGKSFDSRRAANTHQKKIDCHGMMVDFIAQVFSALDLPDNSDRDAAFADMLFAKEDVVTGLLKGRPATPPVQDTTELEDIAEAQAATAAVPVGEIDLSQTDAA